MIAIIDYGVGNLFSVEKAFAKLGADVTVTSDEKIIAAAEKIVLPGVGAFGDCMKNLNASGLVPAVFQAVEEQKPLLGICVGLQVLFEGSEESPEAKGLGIFKGRVKKIQAPGLKIPHMGWNSLQVLPQKEELDLFKGLQELSYVYFVHSFHAVPEDKSIITAVAQYGEQITAAVAKGKVFATQFHPEKSGDVGLHILKNFIEG